MQELERNIIDDSELELIEDTFLNDPAWEETRNEYGTDFDSLPETVRQTVINDYYKNKELYADDMDFEFPDNS